MAKIEKSSAMQTLEEIDQEDLVDYVGGADTNSPIGRTGRLLLMDRAAKDLSAQMKSLSYALETSTKSQSDLAVKVWWLNTVIAIATVVMGAKAAIEIYDWFMKGNG